MHTVPFSRRSAHRRSAETTADFIRSIKTQDSSTDETFDLEEHARAGGWIVIAVLLLLLGASGFIAYRGWTVDNVDVAASGYIAMAFGVIFSLIVGVGLMALIFYSSRKGYDEPPVVVPERRAEDRATAIK
jgi:hypothetical protein